MQFLVSNQTQDVADTGGNKASLYRHALLASHKCPEIELQYGHSVSTSPDLQISKVALPYCTWAVHLTRSACAPDLTCSLNRGMGALSSVSTFNPKRVPTFIYVHVLYAAASARASEPSQHSYIGSTVILFFMMTAHHVIFTAIKRSMRSLVSSRGSRLHGQANTHRYKTRIHRLTEIVCKQSFLPQIRTVLLKPS